MRSSRRTDTCTHGLRTVMLMVHQTGQATLSVAPSIVARDVCDLSATRGAEADALLDMA